MAGFSYANISKTASDLIARFGDDINILDNAGNTLASAKGIKLKFKPLTGSNGGGQQGDINLLVGSGVEVTIQNKIVIGSNTYQVIAVETVDPGDNIIVYNLNLALSSY